MIITLLSDLGSGDAEVTIVKAILTSALPKVHIVDISHSVPQFNLQQAAYLLLSAYKHFPDDTIHIIVVDVFAGVEPGMLLYKYQNQYFIAPDNGILPLVFGEEIRGARLCYEFKKPYSFNEWPQKAAKIAQAIEIGQIESLYKPCELKTSLRFMQPKILHDGVECNILYIDQFENVVLDITRVQFEEIIGSNPFRIRVTRSHELTTISNNYNDVGENEALCRFNDTGYLEIAINQGKAATLLGLAAFNSGNLLYQTIKISLLPTSV